MKATLSICRDCGHQEAKNSQRCSVCASPRILYHDELAQLQIAHLDCDAFYAAVEKRDDPSLLSKPVIIGGGKRGVVSTACYVARTCGVHSAMPMFKALKACPDAVVIKPDMKKYAKVGREIRQLMQGLTPAVEPLSIDEAFMDLSGTQNLHKAVPAEILVNLAIKIQQEIGITVSVGLSYCKFLAKVASDLHKPRGFSVIGVHEAFDFLRKQDVSIVWGIGKASQKLLARDGITTLAHVQDREEAFMMAHYGLMGQRLWRLARGQDERPVNASTGMKSISSETTFFNDLGTLDDLIPPLRRLTEKVSKRLKAKHLAGKTVHLKLKTANFKSLTRSHSLADPTQLKDKIFTIGRTLLQKEVDNHTRFRLIGIGVSQLVDDHFSDPLDLVDRQGQKRADLERAVDKIHAQFGDSAAQLGLIYKTRNHNSD